MSNPIKKTKKSSADILLSWEVPAEDLIAGWQRSGIFLVLFLLLVYSLLANNFLLSLIAIFAGVFFYFLSKKEGVIYKFRITKKGIKTPHDFRDFQHLRSFWIFYEVGPESRKELSLETDNKFTPYLHLPLSNELNPNLLREILQKYLPEEKHPESFLDRI